MHRHRLFMLLVVGATVTLSLLSPTHAFGEQELGADGQRCDSCGSECSTVCGSRAFRACCFNYIKKRSGSGSGPGQEGHHDHDPTVPVKVNGGGGRNSRLFKLRRSGSGWMGDYETPPSDGTWTWVYSSPLEEGGPGGGGAGSRALFIGNNPTI